MRDAVMDYPIKVAEQEYQSRGAENHRDHTREPTEYQIATFDAPYGRRLFGWFHRNGW